MVDRNRRSKASAGENGVLERSDPDWLLYTFYIQSEGSVFMKEQRYFCKILLYFLGHSTNSRTSETYVAEFSADRLHQNTKIRRFTVDRLDYGRGGETAETHNLSMRNISNGSG